MRTATTRRPVLFHLGFAACAAAALHAQPAPLPHYQPFERGEVMLTAGPLADQADTARAFLLALDEDNLLHGFRTRDGADAPGHAMGGWYDPDGFAGAHPFGQFISALARFHADTGDPECKAKADRLVAGFAETIRDDGFFYSSQKAFDDWGCYIYDKSCVAMREAHTLAGSPGALQTLRRLTDWAVPNLDRRNDEWYILGESLYLCHDLTGEERYLDLAREFDAGEYYWGDLARGGNAWHTDRHAYSHVNALLSACRAYERTGDPMYLAAARNGWAMLARDQQWASGGWGPDEHFVDPGEGELASMLGSTTSHFETVCGSYAHVNIDRWLLCQTGDAAYADHMERVLFSAMLGALPPRTDGLGFYYSDYSPGARKRYRDDQWTCCIGTYSQIAADYPLDVFVHSADALAVVLYTPSVVTWQGPGGGVRVEQRTAFPAEGAVRIEVATAVPQRFDLRLRVPAWANAGVRVTVDGEAVVGGRPQRGFLSIERRWSGTTRVELTLPMELRWAPLAPESPDLAALMAGPVMLVALADGPVDAVAAAADPASRIIPVEGKPLNFRLGGTTFIPWISVTDERYTTYCTLSEPREP